MSVSIQIDKEKCRFSMYDPLGCKKCIRVCGMCVLASRPTKKRDFSVPREQRVDPTIWMLVIPWEDYCNGCGACVQVCPTGAISVTIDGKPVGKRKEVAVA